MNLYIMYPFILTLLSQFIISQSSEKPIIDITKEPAHWACIKTEFYSVSLRSSYTSKRYLIIQIIIDSLSQQTQTDIDNHNALKLNRAYSYLFIEAEEDIRTIEENFPKIFPFKNRALGITRIDSDEYNKHKEVVDNITIKEYTGKFNVHLDYVENSTDENDFLSPYKFELGSKGVSKIIYDPNYDFKRDIKSLKNTSAAYKNKIIKKLMRKGTIGKVMPKPSKIYNRRFFSSLNRRDAEWRIISGQENVEKLQDLLKLKEGRSHKIVSIEDVEDIKMEDEPENKSKNKSWIIHAAIWGSLAVLFLGGLGLVYFLRRNKKKEE